MHTEQRSVRSIAYWNGLCSGRVTRVVLHLQSTVTTLTDTNWLHNAQTRNYTLIATAPVTVSFILKSNSVFEVYFVLIFIYDTHTLTVEELINSRGITMHLLLFLHFTKYIYRHWNMFQITDIYGSFYILLTMHHVMILGKWPTWRIILFYVFIFIFNSLHVWSTMCSKHVES